MKNPGKLALDQLEVTLKNFRPLAKVQSPPKGWIRAIRTTLGMNGRQLADRLHVYRARTSQIERDELTGALTVKTLRRVAEALGCTFVYGFVPRTSLKKTVRAQAEKVAAARLARASQTMALEDQALGTEENKRVLSDMIEDLVDQLPRDLWDEP